MTVGSVREAMSCMGLGNSGDVSVMWHVFGFRRAQPPTDPDTGTNATVSLGDVFTGLSGRHLNLNVITVGLNTLPAGTFDDSLDWATFRMRQIYAPVNVGVGRVQHYEVRAADARGYDDIADGDEADDLHDEWSVNNDGIDAFFVRNIQGTLLGRSPIDGDCGKNSKDDGLLAGGADATSAHFVARTLAHEVGHYLDLEHNHDDDECPTSTSGRSNLMAQTRCAQQVDSTVRTPVNLTSSQGSTMRSHCTVKGGC